MLGLLYVIKLHVNGEEYVKVGITKYDVPRRYSKECREEGFVITEIYTVQLPLYIAYKLEQVILTTLVEHKATPTVSFPGWTECLQIESEEHIMNIVNEQHGS